MPIMIPIRHMRPHIGFSWLLANSIYLTFAADSQEANDVSKLMELINVTALGIIISYGLLYQEHLAHFVLVPSDINDNAPNIWTFQRQWLSKFLVLQK